MAAARKGDDALLRLHCRHFRGGRLSRRSAWRRRRPAWCAEKARWAGSRRTPITGADIAPAFAIVHALGALDVGQAAVVCEGLALAVEAAEGTDAMIARIADFARKPARHAGKKRGVLVKALKPTQDAKTDMPVIGRRDGAQCRRGGPGRHRGGSGQGA